VPCESPVIGSGQTISMAADAGQLQLNVVKPVIAACTFEAQTMFINTARTPQVECVEGDHGKPRRVPAHVDYSIGTIITLNAMIGYDRSTELGSAAARTGRGILPLIRGKKILNEEEIAELLDPVAMTGQARRHA